jgi:hypothetical protein
LYLTTSTGALVRYDVKAQQLLSPFPVGNALNGADITPDGRYLYVTENQRGPQGLVHKVNLDDGTVSNLAYEYSGAEQGSWDLAVAGGKALFSTGYSGSGATVPLHQIDLASDALSTRMNVFPNALLSRGADGSLVFGVEPTASKGPIFAYDAASDGFRLAQIGGFLSTTLSAVSRDGALIAMKRGSGVAILDRNLNLLRNLFNVNGAVAFDPNSDILYAGSSSSNQVIAFDTNTWNELYRVDIGEPLGGTGPFGSGEMQVSDDSTLLFVSTPTGVRALNLPTLAPSAAPQRAPSSPPGRGTADIPPLALEGGLATPANRPDGPAIFAPTALEVSSTREAVFSARVGPTLRAPTQGRQTAPATGRPSGHKGDPLDGFPASAPQDWIPDTDS